MYNSNALRIILYNEDDFYFSLLKLKCTVKKNIYIYFFDIENHETKETVKTIMKNLLPIIKITQFST